LHLIPGKVIYYEINTNENKTMLFRRENEVYKLLINEKKMMQFLRT